MLTLRTYQQEAVTKIKSRMREANHPLLVNMSVGAGKSLCLSEILLWIERANYRALCLTMNSTLVSQNNQTYQNQGGNSGIYCSGLKEKDTNSPVIFGSPQSVVLGIKGELSIAKVPFNLIIVDEAHNIDGNNNDTIYMRILNWYGYKAQEEGRSFRVLGLTGTPYRGKSVSIIGPYQYFKEEVVKVQMPWLIENGYLCRPHFEITKDLKIDFSNCKVNSMGKFSNTDLENSLGKDERLTGKIMREIVSIVEPSAGGAFIFASTLNHVQECMRSLPSNACYIVASTPHHERKRILEAANRGEIKYLVNVATLLVGVDVPRFHIAAFLRPTESLVLFNQAIGRALRLFPGKSRALILDYADNLSRFQDFDDPIVNQALDEQAEGDPDYCIPCYQCGIANTVTARRCRGIVDNVRCDYYFEWKDCFFCSTQNDNTARACRECGKELIDPNVKLKPIPIIERIKVDTMDIRLNRDFLDQPHSILIVYNRSITETYMLTSTKALNIFYANFVRKHVNNPSEYYMSLSEESTLLEIIQCSQTPEFLILSTIDGHTRIKSKEFI